MRDGTRHTAVVATAAAALLCLAAPGAAGDEGRLPDPAPGGPQRPYEPEVTGPRNVDTLDAAITPDGGTAHGVRVAFDRTSRAEPAGPPAAARRFVFLFDAGLRFRPDSFPTCTRTTIERHGVQACPQGSRIGRGTSHSYPEGTAEVHAVNTRHPGGTRGALVVIPAAGTILELTWERVTPHYQRAGYRWALDEILPPTATPPDQRVGTRRFELTWGATRRTGDGRPVSFAETTARPGAELRIGLWSEFVTGQTVLPETTAVRP